MLTAAAVLALCLPLHAAEPDPHEGVRVRLKALERLLKRTSSANDEILESLGSLERAYRILPDETTLKDEMERKRVDKLKTGIEKAWIRALTVMKIPPRSDHNLRTPVQIRATEAIARSRPCIDARFRRALERRVLDNKKYECTPALYRAAFSALVTLNQPKLVPWFLDHGVTADVNLNDKAKTLAAFDALRSMRGVRGAERREVVRKLLAVFQSYPFHWLNEYEALSGFRGAQKKYVKVAGTATPYWTDIRTPLLETIRHFCLDPRTGVPPFDKRTGREIEHLPRYLNWFATNQRVSMWPWRDVKASTKPAVRKRSEGRYARPAIPLLFHRFGIPWEYWREHAHDPTRPRTRESSAEADEAASTAFRKKLAVRLATPLTELLDDLEPRVRAAAAVALAMVGAKEAASQLVALVESEELPVVREAAALGLMLLHPEDLRSWFQARVRDNDESPRVRGYATLALGWLKDAPFLWALVDESGRRALGGVAAYEDVRSCAVVALGLVGEADAAEPLAKLLTKAAECPAVVAAVGAALSRLDDRSVVPRLLKVLVDRGKKPLRRVAQVSAAQGLGALVVPTDRAAIRAIGKRIDMSREKFGGVRSALAIALGRIGGSNAAEVLEAAYADCLKSTERFAERGFFLMGFALLESSTGRHRIRKQLGELKHDRDLGAAAAAVALGDDRLGVGQALARIDATGPNYTPYAIEAAGRLGALQNADDVRDVLARRPDPRVARAGSLALARLLGPAALTDLKQLWERAHTHDLYDTLAWACHHMPSGEVESWLHTIVKQKERQPHERAFAVLALARMAGGETLPRALAFSFVFNPFGEARTLTGLALRRDAAFLR